VCVAFLSYNFAVNKKFDIHKIIFWYSNALTRSPTLLSIIKWLVNKGQ
jgi:hypothetical protein